MTDLPATPEHDKLMALRDRRDAIVDFIDWLEENGHAVCRVVGDEPWRTWMPLMSIGARGRLIGQFLGVDYDALEAEKVEIIRHLSTTHL